MRLFLVQSGNNCCCNGSMKGETMKNILFAVAALVAVVALICLVPCKQANTEYLRIHIRADSNSQADQTVKYKVKAAVVDYLTPYIAYADTKQKACLLYTSPSPRDGLLTRMPSSA